MVGASLLLEGLRAIRASGGRRLRVAKTEKDTKGDGHER